jgi:propanediol dehydratase large subunit
MWEKDMKSSATYNHGSEDMREALGIKKSQEQMFAIATECMIKGQNERFSVAMAKAIELCETPEELAIVISIMCKRIAPRPSEPSGKGVLTKWFGRS